MMTGHVLGKSILDPDPEEDGWWVDIWLKAGNKRYSVFIYPGTQHAFNNDTGAARYNKAAADLAFTRTLAFFKENLGAPKGV